MHTGNAVPPEPSPDALAKDLQVAATTCLMEALVESEKRMRMRIDLLSEVVFELDDRHCIVFLNRAWFLVLGINPQHALGLSLCDFVLAEDRDGALGALLAAGADYSCARPTFRFVGADGALRWLEMSVVTRPGGGYVGALKDVTGQKQTQDELERMSLVANHTDNLVVITDASGRVEWVNKAFTRSTGYTLEEIAGRIPGHFLQGPDTEAQEVVRIRQLVQAAESFKSEILNYTRAGQPYWTTMFVSPVRGQDGSVQRYIAVQSDSTQLHKAQQALQLEKVRAEAANRSKSDFLSTMSHELRTPLNGILGMAQLLEMPGVDAESQREYVDVIRSSGESLLSILNDILELSKIEAGKIELRSGPFSPERLLAETRMLYCEPAWTKGLVIQVEWLSNATDCYEGDALRIKQILNNLVSNAIKFTNAGSVHVTGREVGRQGSDISLELCVTDTGIGIPQDKQGLLFQPFSQIDNSSTRKAGGTGLGLSIVRRLAELMGGSVQLDSTPGAGTRITVQLVVKAGAKAVAGSPDATPAALREAPAMTNNHVLIVEDTPINAMLLRTYLKRLGVQADHVVNGQEAIEYVMDGKRPDMIFMDCQMPVMDGFEATTRIRAYEKKRGVNHPIPIVALTASAFEEDRNRCMASGMDAFITKPLNFDVLRSVMGQVGASTAA